MSSKLRLEVKTKEFQKSLHGTVKNVRIGSRQVMEHTVKAFSKETLKQVPRQRGTLANSYDYKIRASTDIFLADMGYGRKGDPVDPVTGKRASEYMIPVHEDLEAHHEVGKAKYFEDPWREHAEGFRGKLVRRLNQEFR